MSVESAGPAQSRLYDSAAGEMNKYTGRRRVAVGPCVQAVLLPNGVSRCAWVLVRGLRYPAVDFRLRFQPVGDWSTAHEPALCCAQIRGLCDHLLAFLGALRAAGRAAAHGRRGFTRGSPS